MRWEGRRVVVVRSAPAEGGVGGLAGMKKAGRLAIEEMMAT